MAEISTLNGYKIKDKKAIRYYNTVADMVADTTLKNGMYVKTKGYYSEGDGLQNEYIIKSSSDKNHEILNNNLVAELLPNTINTIGPVNLEYMWTHHTELTGFQALCVDDTSYYYYEGNTYNLYKRNLSDNELTETYNIPSFLHGNDMAIIDGVIYNANSTNKYINTFKLSSSTVGTLSCLNNAPTDGFVSGITKYDNSHVIVIMAPSDYVTNVTKISDCALYKVNIINDTYEALNLDFNGLDLQSTSVLQSIEYNDGYLYHLTSQPSMITQFIENGNTFKCINIYDFHDYDINGLPFGEMEGIALLPGTYNGNGTMLIYSQMKDYTTSKSLKFYCFNPKMNLPLVRYPVHQQDYGSPTELNQMYLNANASGYYEIGTSAYPFKKLIDAVHCLNFSKYIKFKEIEITGSGTYYIGSMRNLKAFIISAVEDVIISGPLSIVNGDLHIESTNTNNKITFNINTVAYVNVSKVNLIDININHTLTAALGINNSIVNIDRCNVNTNGLISFEASFATLNFRSFTTTRQDGKFLTIDRNNIVAINSPTSVIPTDSVTKYNSVVLRYNSVQFT